MSALERRVSIRIRKGHSSTLVLRIVLSEIDFDFRSGARVQTMGKHVEQSR
ncbi:hypothetical protein MAUB1S_09578 [Mycolicibacterium aubagnense]